LDGAQTLDRLRSLKHVLYGDGPGDPKAFLQVARSTHLFDKELETVEKFIKEEFP
jgi:hypothetical protein